jgi:hypothetical protein
VAVRDNMKRLNRIYNWLEWFLIDSIYGVIIGWIWLIAMIKIIFF